MVGRLLGDRHVLVPVWDPSFASVAEVCSVVNGQPGVDINTDQKK